MLCIKPFDSIKYRVTPQPHCKRKTDFTKICVWKFSISHIKRLLQWYLIQCLGNFTKTMEKSSFSPETSNIFRMNSKTGRKNEFCWNLSIFSFVPTFFFLVGTTSCLHEVVSIIASANSFLENKSRNRHSECWEHTFSEVYELSVSIVDLIIGISIGLSFSFLSIVRQRNSFGFTFLDCGNFNKCHIRLANMLELLFRFTLVIVLSIMHNKIKRKRLDMNNVPESMENTQ